LLPRLTGGQIQESGKLHHTVRLSLEASGLGEDAGCAIQVSQAGSKRRDRQGPGQRVGELKARQGFVIDLGEAELVA
jgi:hypothetical protein